MLTKLLYQTLLLIALLAPPLTFGPYTTNDDFTLCNANKIYAANDYLYGDSYFKDYEKIATAPRPVGGKDALIAFFNSKVKLTGAEAQTVARYHVIFIVNCNGDLGRFELKSKEFPGYDKIIEACKHMPKWLPAKKDGVNVDCYFRLGFTNRAGELLVDYRE